MFVHVRVCVCVHVCVFMHVHVQGWVCVCMYSNLINSTRGHTAAAVNAGRYLRKNEARVGRLLNKQKSYMK